MFIKSDQTGLQEITVVIPDPASVNHGQDFCSHWASVSSEVWRASEFEDEELAQYGSPGSCSTVRCFPADP